MLEELKYDAAIRYSTKHYCFIFSHFITLLNWSLQISQFWVFIMCFSSGGLCEHSANFRN